MFPLSRYLDGLINYHIRNRTIHKIISNNSPTHDPTWYNSDYSKRKKITITGGASGAQIDYQLKLAITYMAAMQSNFDDLRFTKGDGVTLIDVWLEDKTDNTAADIWVEFPTTPINTVTQDYYMYYGKIGATNNWNIKTTFIFGDSFEDGNTTNAGDLYVTANNQASSDQKKTGTYSMLLEKGAGTALYSTSLGELLINSVIIEHSIYFPDISGGERKYNCSVMDGMDEADKGCNFKFENETTWAYYNDAWHDLSLPFNIGWNHIKIHQNTTNADIWVNGTKSNNVPNYNTISNINKIYHYEAFSTDNIYIDNILVRKYIANPPTYTFEAEESY